MLADGRPAAGLAPEEAGTPEQALGGVSPAWCPAEEGTKDPAAGPERLSSKPTPQPKPPMADC